MTTQPYHSMVQGSILQAGQSELDVKISSDRQWEGEEGSWGGGGVGDWERERDVCVGKEDRMSQDSRMLTKPLGLGGCGS